MSLPKTMKKCGCPRTTQILYHSIGRDESYPKMQVLSDLRNFFKIYGHLSEILVFYLKLSPNMVKSRDSWC